MKTLSPLLKGLISGVLMVGVSLALNATGQSSSAWAQYLFYILYAAAITWALIGYYHSPGYTPAFGSIFGQGFRCFIMITLVSVIFTGIYASLPGVADESAKLYREDLDKTEKNKTPAEKDKLVEDFRKQYVTGNISIAIFGSLVTGCVFTAAGAGLLLLRKK